MAQKEEDRFSVKELRASGRKLYGKVWIGDLTRTEEWLLRGVSGITKEPNSALPGHHITIFHRGDWKNKSLQERREVVAGREIEMWAQWQAAVEWLQDQRGRKPRRKRMTVEELEREAEASVAAGNQSENTFSKKMMAKGATKRGSEKALRKALQAAGLPGLKSGGKPKK